MSVSVVNNLVISNIKQVLGLATASISVFNGLVWSSGAAANPQLQFFENFPGKNMTMIGFSSGFLSVHAVNIPLSLSFNNVLVLHSFTNSTGTTGRTITNLFGLYSLNGSTLSLTNSASTTFTYSGGGGGTFASINWVSMVTSATQNITPGPWYLAFCHLHTGEGALTYYGNSSINPANAAPALIRGRMTASTNAIPASIATSDLDITGSDAMRQPYIIITA